MDIQKEGKSEFTNTFTRFETSSVTYSSVQKVIFSCCIQWKGIWFGLLSSNISSVMRMQSEVGVGL